VETDALGDVDAHASIRDIRARRWAIIVDEKYPCRCSFPRHSRKVRTRKGGVGRGSLVLLHSGFGEERLNARQLLILLYC